MDLKQKLQNAKGSTWLSDALTQEEKVAAAMSAEIASFLQKYRKSHGLTQDELAKILHVSKDDIIRWEDGDEDFTIANLAKIATSLHLHLRNLFGAIDEILVV
ncbi:MAG: helix-turn-helix transcriptional regulator [Firmicutes bacterium]|nr:helix-turn-helix transcriptional regulator [Bacillota bacterium]